MNKYNPDKLPLNATGIRGYFLAEGSNDPDLMFAFTFKGGRRDLHIILNEASKRGRVSIGEDVSKDSNIQEFFADITINMTDDWEETIRFDHLSAGYLDDLHDMMKRKRR